ncbi:RICIN domain-containing protein [Oligoflexus tunisiensis]|uniref:RICIN domain-containing protein n=1 Tax=Oligoflexus tunisiensis TaxID=708132 RepID=UPI00114C9212|nr:RICIN domain-containing protein [Oligoflexus tunisiensis]
MTPIMLAISIASAALLFPACGGRQTLDPSTDEGAKQPITTEDSTQDVSPEKLPHLIQFSFSRKCIEIDGGRADDEARAIQVSCNESDRQLFMLLSKPGGYQLQNVLTGKCLAAAQFGTKNGTPITQAPCLSANSQLFEKSSAGKDSFYLVHVNSKRCLQIETNQPNDRLGVELFDCLRNETQRVIINPINHDL